MFSLERTSIVLRSQIGLKFDLSTAQKPCFCFGWFILTSILYHAFSQSKLFADGTEIKVLHETKSVTEN